MAFDRDDRDSFIKRLAEGSKTVKEIKAYSLYGVEGLNVVLPKTIENIRPYSLFKVNFYYEGTAEEREMVTKNFDYNPTIYFYSVDRPSQSGNYWHYENGNIVKWDN